MDRYFEHIWTKECDLDKRKQLEKLRLKCLRKLVPGSGRDSEESGSLKLNSSQTSDNTIIFMKFMKHKKGAIKEDIGARNYNKKMKKYFDLEFERKENLHLT